MTAYWWGVATPFLAALALTALFLLAAAAYDAWRFHGKDLWNALWLLTPRRQRQVLANMRAPAIRRKGEEWMTVGYDKREAVYALEAAMRGEGARGHISRLAALGAYRILATEIPRLATEYRAQEALAEKAWLERMADVDKEQRERRAADAAFWAYACDHLHVDTPVTATRIEFGSGAKEFKPDLDVNVFIPAAAEHEADPDRPNSLVRTPALAIRLHTRAPVAFLWAYWAGGARLYDGIAPLTRLREARPDLLAVDPAEYDAAMRAWAALEELVPTPYALGSHARVHEHSPGEADAWCVMHSGNAHGYRSDPNTLEGESHIRAALHEAAAALGHTEAPATIAGMRLVDAINWLVTEARAVTEGRPS